MPITERLREFRHAGTLKLAGFAIVVVYAMPWLVYGAAATQRGHQEDNGIWLIGFAGLLVGVALLGLRHPVLAGSILIVPSVCLGLLFFAYDPQAWAYVLQVFGIFGTPAIAGLLLLLAGLRDRRTQRRGRVVQDAAPD